MVASYVHTLRLFNRNVRLYLITAFLLGFTVFGGIVPILSNLFVLRLGYGPEFIGLLSAAGGLSMALFCIPAGMLGTRYGSRQLMIAGLTSLFVGNGLFALVEFVPVDLRSAWMVTMAVVTNIGMACYFVNANPFLMASTNEAERSHAFSVQAAAGPLAAFAGSLVGGLLPGLFAAAFNMTLTQPAPFRYPLLLAALVLIVAILAMMATEDLRDAPVAGRLVGGSGSTVARAPYLLIAFLAFFIALQVTGEAMARTFFNVYLDAGLGVPTAQIGLIAALGQLVAVPAALLTPLSIERWGYRATYVGSTLLLAGSLLPLALVPTPAMAGLGFMGVMMLASVARPAISVFGMLLVAPAWRNLASGTTTMAVALSFACMGLLGGYLIVTLGYPALFLAGALFSALGGVLFWLYFRRLGGGLG
jgi:MFS family permease